MNGKAIAIIIIVALAIIGAVWFTGSKDKAADQKPSDDKGSVAGTNTTGTLNSENNSEYLLFYGSTCPHCKTVDEFLKENDVLAKVPYQHLEVYGNRQNASLMQEKQNQCRDLSENDKGGVPFLYTPEKCVVGDQPIIDWFSQKIGIK